MTNPKDRIYERSRFLALQRILGRDRLCELTIDACDNYRRLQPDQDLDVYCLEHVERYLGSLQNERLKGGLFENGSR
jgi:hypothetical protein